jgi:cysteinyl-tRNA synthetase
MDDDFNSGAAVSDLFLLLTALNKYADRKKLEDADSRDERDVASFCRGVETLRELSAILGLFQKPPTTTAAGGDEALTDNLVRLLVDLRTEARKNKDFTTADRIRDELDELGVKLEDRKGGTDWRLQ